MENRALISKTVEKMILLSGGNMEDINHFLKVWAFTRTIALSEKVDENTLFTLELTAVVHDIACPICRIKYGNTDGTHQEEESPALIKEFFSDIPVPSSVVERISYLVSRHHTYSGVEGIDWRILLEADYLVNAYEHKDSPGSIESMRERVFRTETGKRLLDSVYLERSSV